MDFYNVLKHKGGYSYNPYAGQDKTGNWVEGMVSIDYLNDNFSHLKGAEEMINATPYEGYKRYFSWLKEQGVLN